MITSGKIILSVDPGKNTGVGLWNEEGKYVFGDTINNADFFDLINNYKNRLTKIVYEEFRNDHRTSRLKGSKNDASQIIGAIKYHAFIYNTKIFEQPNTILRLASMHSGIEIPEKSHLDDTKSAFLHGWWFFELNGFDTEDLKKINHMD